MDNKIEQWLEKRGQDIKNEWIDVVTNDISLCESPIEKLFLIEWHYQNDNFYFGGDLIDYTITPQYKIDNYRVDFMICFNDKSVNPYDNKDNCLIVELDSYLWHGSDPEQFTKEKARERDITKEGYKLMRFSGREVYRDVERCVRESMGYCLTKER